MLKRLRKNHPLGYCVGAEVLFLGSLVLTSILVVFLLMLFRFDLNDADDYLLGCIQELVGVGVAVPKSFHSSPIESSSFIISFLSSMPVWSQAKAIMRKSSFILRNRPCRRFALLYDNTRKNAKLLPMKKEKGRIRAESMVY